MCALSRGQRLRPELGGRSGWSALSHNSGEGASARPLATAHPFMTAYNTMMTSTENNSPPAPAAWAALERLGTRHVLPCPDGEVVWRRFGAGPPLLLLHGGHGSWLHWVRNIEALSQHRTLWLPDMPGFGESSNLAGPPHGPNRLERLVDALLAGLDTLIGPGAAIDLAAFSFGALVAAELAQRKTVRSMALLGAGGHGGPRRMTEKLLDWRFGPVASRSAALRQNLGSFMLHAPEAVDAMALAVYQAQCQATRFRSKSISMVGGLQSRLASYEGRLLLVWGEHDVTAVPQDLAPAIAATRSGWEWRLLAGGGHWVQYECHEPVNQLLEDWFGANL